MRDADDTAGLPVAEQFYSIQGEGPTAGTPAVFFRTGGCNLLCGAPADPDAPQEALEPNDATGATWVCDTIETWRSATTTTLSEIVETWDANGWLARLQSGAANLVVTGGEPMLHREPLAELVSSTDVAHVEIETNGTIARDDHPVDPYVSQYNVSLKLSNSGMPEHRRLEPDAIDSFVADDRATFKFVVSRRADLTEIDKLTAEFDIPHDRIMLMPAGAARADLEVTAERVAELAMETGYRYSPRLHVDIWNQATGV